MAQWIECQPSNQRIASLIPSQGICLGFRPGSLYGVCKKQPNIDVSLLLSLPSPLSKNKLIKSFKERIKKKLNLNVRLIWSLIAFYIAFPLGYFLFLQVLSFSVVCLIFPSPFEKVFPILGVKLTLLFCLARTLANTLFLSFLYCTGGKHKACRPNPALHLVLSVPAPCFYPAAAPSSLPLVKE